MFSLATALLQAALTLLLTVQSTPNISEAFRQNAIQTAHNAISFATQVINQTTSHTQQPAIPQPAPTPATPGLPVITSFTSSAPSLTLGQSFTLFWNTIGANQAAISGIGTVAASGNTVVTPTSIGTQTYALTAANAAGSVTANVTITVHTGTSVLPPAIASPTIDLFIAMPSSVTAGGTATLLWTTSGATSLSIDQGIGVATGLSSKTVTPSQTTTYTLTATNSAGTVSRSVTVQVNQPATAFSSAFPNYIDSVTGNRVYQISNDPGVNYVLYSHQYYYSDADSVIIVNIPPGDWRPIFYKINVRTGAKTLLSDKIANGELVKGNNFYGYNFSASLNYLGRQNIANGQWQSLYSIPSGWIGSGSVTVNSANTYAIFSIAEQNNMAHQKTFLLNLLTNGVELLREEPAVDGEVHNHYQFSPTNPDLFTFTSQQLGFGLSRLRVGSASLRRLEAIDLQASSGEYFSPSVFGSANMAHPIWNADGRLCTDILWHTQNPPGMYGFACFNLATDPFGVISRGSQELRFIPVTNWNVHFKDTNRASWFVGDGDLHKLVDGVNQNRFTNLLHLTSETVSGDLYRTNVYNLAEIKGPGSDFANAHLVADNEGVITTWDHSIAGQGTRNVFLIELPGSLRNLLN